MLYGHHMTSSYKQIIHEASMSAFPDLVLEMGFCIADPFVVDCMMENPDKDDQVMLTVFVQGLP